MKDISFIVPVYNTPTGKLEKCIESIFLLNNKFDIEIIVVDDGSKDFIRTYFQKKIVGELVYIYKENRGVSSARNVGLNIAKGKYICFVDSDDVILEDAFKDIKDIDFIDKYQFIIFDLDVIENGRKFTWKVLDCEPGRIEQKDVIEELIKSSKMNSPCSKLFLNDHIKQNNIRFNENMITGEDKNFVIDYIQCATGVYYTGRSAYCYQREEVSRTIRIKKFPDLYLNNISSLRNESESLIKEYNLDDKYLSILNADHVEGLYNYISDLMMLKLCTSKRKENVSNELQILKFDSTKVSQKKRLKYKLLCYKKWKLIYILAVVRKIYLRFK